VVLELPADDPAINTAAMYRAMEHRRPLVNGYSGHTPRHYDLLSQALRRGDPGILTDLGRGRPLVVVVHGSADEDDQWRGLVEKAGGVLIEESELGPVFIIRSPLRGEARPR
jgi:hypothetical protein